MAKLVLLGPQQPHSDLAHQVRTLDMRGPYATITAGWQEREAEVEELDAALGESGYNLQLHQRADDIFERDAEFRDAHREHQDQLKRLQEIYRIRLDYAMNAIRKLESRGRSMAPDILDSEIEHAFGAVRELDRHHLDRIRACHQRFQEQWRPGTRPAAEHHRRQLAAILERCNAIFIAGGHVVVLLNRLRLMGLEPFLKSKPVIAWSAGAMVLGEKIVAFHDSPPQGRGYAEVLETGMGLFTRVLPLPHAHKRLLLHKRRRVAAFARRFAGEACLTMENGSRIDWYRGHWRAVSDVKQLTSEGVLTTVEAA